MAVIERITPNSGRLAWIGVSIAVGALFLVSFLIGPYPVPPRTVFAVALHELGIGEATWPDAVRMVVMEIRGPRIVGALLIGAALATAGATFQNIFRNPLVSPGVLGVSAGAGFGAALGILIGTTGLMIQVLAFGFGLLATGLAMWLGRSLDRAALLSLVLAGLVVSALFQALVSLLKVVADPLNQLPSITFWLLGGLHRLNGAALLSVALPILIPGALLYALRWQVHAMAAGDDEARALGVDVTRTRLVLIVAATLMTAACVSVSGIVGWVGLLIPHLVRLLVGPSFALVLPLSALGGGAFLLAVDNVARVGASEIPLGILTALIGAPLFAAVLMRTRQRWS
ncbi:MAG: iron ABC transporter permease [Rubrivivax sp.]|jgi:iron complex transport system permease protein|nr:iron ABC transporter permease [Rubrivivax sp.]